jgi:hypothetical protein
LAEFPVPKVFRGKMDLEAKKVKKVLMGMMDTMVSREPKATLVLRENMVLLGTKVKRDNAELREKTVPMETME